MSRFRVGLAVVAMMVTALAVPGDFTVGGGVEVANAAPIPGGSITTVCTGTNVSGTFTLTADCPDVTGPITGPITVPSTITTVNGNGHTISATDIGGSPPFPQFNGGILTNDPANHSMNIENLTVSGPATGFQVCTNSGNVLYGIYFNDASGSVNNVTVEHIWQQPNASNAPSCNTGTAIRAENPSAPRTVTITNTKVFDYQKNGIDGRGATMTMAVSGSTIGPPNDQEGLIAANGLVYFDSTGTAMNNTILGSGDQACPFPPCVPGTGGTTNATAVLLFGAKNVTITQNTISGDKTDIGVSVSAGSTASTGSIISFNNFTRTSPDVPDPTGHGIDVFTPDGSSATPICNTFSNWNTNVVGAEQIACTPLPNGTECQAYGHHPLVVDSGKNYTPTSPFPIIDATPFTWTVDSGTLPPGLSLSSGGAITGIPTAAGTFNFTLKLVDSTGLTATQAQTITIDPGCAPPPTTTTTPTPPPPTTTTTPTPPPTTTTTPTPPPAKSTVQVVKTWVGTPSTTTIFVDADGQAPYDASVVADTNGASTSFAYPVGTSVRVGETAIPSGFTATIDCGQGAQTYTAPITVNAPATAGATLACRIVNTANPAPPPRRPTLVIEKVANKHIVHGGNTIQFTITIRARGQATATNVQMCDVLPTGLVFVRAPGATFSGGRACWRIASISTGQSRSYRVTVRANSVQHPTFRTNVATVTSPGTDCTARRVRRRSTHWEARGASLARCSATARVLVRPLAGARAGGVTG